MTVGEARTTDCCTIQKERGHRKKSPGEGSIPEELKKNINRKKGEKEFMLNLYEKVEKTQKTKKQRTGDFIQVFDLQNSAPYDGNAAVEHVVVLALQQIMQKLAPSRGSNRAKTEWINISQHRCTSCLY